VIGAGLKRFQGDLAGNLAQAAAAAIGALADASQEWQSAIGSAFVGWAMAQADADFGIAAAIAGATAGKAGAAAGSIYSAAVSKAAGDLTRALNAVQTGFVDAATEASVKATKTIAAAETVEREKVPATKSGPNAVGSSKGTYLNMLGREVRPARHTPNGIQNPLLRDLDKGMWQQETHFFIEEILRKAR
jgi:hypothetical protein